MTIVIILKINKQKNSVEETKNVDIINVRLPPENAQKTEQDEASANNLKQELKKEVNSVIIETF